MKPKETIVLSLSENYLSHWTIFDALRELYQNSFDRKEENPECPLINEVNLENKNEIMLRIGNYYTELPRRTLILGETSKSESKKTIGKFGEGYKLAMLVLLRNGISVDVYTGSERWEATLEYNKQFETKMLTLKIWDFEPQENLVFKITGLPKSAYHSYTQYNLALQPNSKKKRHGKCDILLDKRNRGKVFVGGLYVCDYPGKSLYGYNFDPDVFPLGRDRNIINGFDLNWESSRALIKTKVEDIEMLENLAENTGNTDDTRHISSFSKSTDALTTVLWDKYIKEYPDTIPVASQSSIKAMQQKYIGIQCVVISENILGIIKDSEGYRAALESYEEKPPRLSPMEVVSFFYDNYHDEMSDILKQKYAETILSESVDWINRE